MVYASLAFTVLHNLMVTIALGFFVVAVLALLQALYASRAMPFLVAGCACLVVLIASATLYYGDLYPEALPWGQRASFAFFAIWLVSLDFAVPALRLGRRAP